MSHESAAECKPHHASLRVSLISGAPSVGRCGIHDYVEQLASALRTLAGVEATVLLNQDWSPSGLWRLGRRVRAERPDVLHMQYPMIVGWRSPGPQLFGFAKLAPQVVTLHEFSSFKKGRQASMGAFAMSAKRLVFTTEFERDRFLRWFPRTRGKSDIAPIGSNIPFLPHRKTCETTVVHFGQIKPGRGLEEFFELARLATAKGRSWRFKIVGAPVDWAEEFTASARRQTEGTNVSWHLNLDAVQVAEILRSAAAAYLPYPDGASERRGSLIASLGNGLPVVTTRGPFQTSELERVVAFADTPGQAYEAIVDLVDQPARAEAMRVAAASYVQRFDWQTIAESHRKIYAKAANP